MIDPWLIDKLKREKAEQDAVDHREWARQEQYRPEHPPDRLKHYENDRTPERGCTEISFTL